MDIDGDTGGYNIQAAFSTAYSAVKKIMADISEKTSPPNDVQNLVLTPDSTYPHVLHITWDAITNYDLDKYELRTGTSSWFPLLC